MSEHWTVYPELLIVLAPTDQIRTFNGQKCRLWLGCLGPGKPQIRFWVVGVGTSDAETWAALGRVLKPLPLSDFPPGTLLQ